VAFRASGIWLDLYCVRPSATRMTMRPPSANNTACVSAFMHHNRSMISSRESAVLAEMIAPAIIATTASKYFRIVPA
jgi:hypothetical protein